MAKKTPVIPWRYWWWTHGDENLFLLSPEDLYTFKLLVEGYYACTCSWDW